MSEWARILRGGKGSKFHVLEEPRLGVLDEQTTFRLFVLVVRNVALVSDRVRDVAGPTYFKHAAPFRVRYDAGTLKNGLKLRKGCGRCSCLRISRRTSSG